MSEMYEGVCWKMKIEYKPRKIDYVLPDFQQHLKDFLGVYCTEFDCYEPRVSGTMFCQLHNIGSGSKKWNQLYCLQRQERSWK